MAIPYKTITFNLDEQTITPESSELLVEGTVGIYKAFFNPDDTWANFDGMMTAVFDPAFGDPVSVEVVDFEAVIPSGALAGPWVRVGVYATDGNRVYPTAWSAQLPVSDGTIII